MKLCNIAAFATLFLAGTTSANLRGAIDVTKDKLYPRRQLQSNQDLACDADVQECSDGSFVSRDPTNGCEFPSCPLLGDSKPATSVIVCAADVQECSDGSFVSRDPTNNCEFPSCPNEDIFCTEDAQECSDGSFVSRDPTNGCEFPSCPNEDLVCAADVQECDNGSFVSRDPTNGCEFPSCGLLTVQKPPPPPPPPPNNDYTTFRFNVRPQEFSPSVMDGYTDCKDLKSHIIDALKAAADKKISDGMGTSCTWYDDYENNDYASAPDMERIPSTGGTKYRPDNGDGVNSYDTNNQVDGADEADLVKANGKHVFLSYSNQIIVTDTNGQILLRQDIPQPTKPENKDVYQNQRTIQGMLLSDDNILSVMTQFYKHTDNYTPLGNAVTTTFVYQFDEIDNLLVLKEEFDTSGSYSTARMINGTNYLITNSNIDTYNFTGELNRCDEKFRGLSDKEYEALAFNIASGNTESFALKIMDALDFTGTDSESCENIVQIFDRNPTETDSLPDMWFIYNNDVLNTFSQITSFQSSEIEDNSKIERSYAGIFLPTSSWNTQTYASENLLVLSGGGYRLANVTDEENRDCQVTYEYTFLVTFDLDGKQNGATLGAAGDVEGSIVNSNLGQFSMDYFDNHLRVATSFSARYGFCPLEDGDRLWKRLDPARSQVSVLQGQDGNLMQVGVTDDLGGDGTIASVRFLGDKGYVSSWQNKDPLYVLDLSDPSSPTKAAELNVTDSLNYMHPLSNGKKLLAVGSASSSMDDADNYVRGLKISLFNVEDSSNPYEEESYVFETIGYSKALSDHHAFRYIPQNGLLSIPGYEESWKDKNYFDGTWLFHIDTDTAVISQFDNVRHAGVDEMTGWYCWNPSQLPSRSMMFNGNLLTMLSHSIALTSNDGNTTITNIVNLDEGRTETKNDDCSQYRGYRYGW